MNMPLKAADLNRHHLGQIISVDKGTAKFTDTLSGVSHIADLIAERPITAEVSTFALGRIETSLTFANAGSIQVAGNTDVYIISA